MTSSTQHATSGNAGRSPLNARRWYAGIYEAITGLAHFPRAHPLAREDDEFEEEVRQIVFKSHRVIYTIHEEMVLIHRVWHVARQNLSPIDAQELTPKPRE